MKSSEPLPVSAKIETTASRNNNTALVLLNNLKVYCNRLCEETYKCRIVDDSDLNSDFLCEAIEKCFFKGLNYSRFKGSFPFWHFLEVLENRMSNQVAECPTIRNTVGAVVFSQKLQNPIALSRAWIRQTLNSGCLSECIREMANHRSDVMFHFYHPDLGILLHDDDCEAFHSLSLMLFHIKFNLMIDDELLNQPRIWVLDEMIIVPKTAAQYADNKNTADEENDDDSIVPTEMLSDVAALFDKALDAFVVVMTPDVKPPAAKSKSRNILKSNPLTSSFLHRQTPDGASIPVSRFELSSKYFSPVGLFGNPLSHVLVDPKRCRLALLDPIQGIPTQISQLMTIIEESISRKDLILRNIFNAAIPPHVILETKLLLDQSDTTSDLNIDPLLAGEMIKLFFVNLPEPLIPFSTHDALIEAVSMPDSRRLVTMLLDHHIPWYNRPILMSFIRLLKLLLNEVQLTPVNLSLRVGPCIMRKQPIRDDETWLNVAMEVMPAVSYLIDNFRFVFESIKVQLKQKKKSLEDKCSRIESISRDLNTTIYPSLSLLEVDWISCIKLEIESGLKRISDGAPNVQIDLDDSVWIGFAVKNRSNGGVLLEVEDDDVVVDSKISQPNLTITQESMNIIKSLLIRRKSDFIAVLSRMAIRVLLLSETILHSSLLIDQEDIDVFISHMEDARIQKLTVTSVINRITSMVGELLGICTSSDHGKIDMNRLTQNSDLWRLLDDRCIVEDVVLIGLERFEEEWIFMSLEDKCFPNLKPSIMVTDENAMDTSSQIKPRSLSISASPVVTWILDQRDNMMNRTTLSSTLHRLSMATAFDVDGGGIDFDQALEECLIVTREFLSQLIHLQPTTARHARILSESIVRKHSMSRNLKKSWKKLRSMEFHLNKRQSVRQIYRESMIQMSDLTRQTSQEFMKSFIAMPIVIGNPSILTVSMLSSILPHIPDRIRSLYLKWKLVFNSSTDGSSIDTAIRLLKGHHNTLLLIRDNKNFVFGGFSTTQWVNNGMRYYGDGESFVFTFSHQSSQLVKRRASSEDDDGVEEYVDKWNDKDVDPEVAASVYRSSGINQFFQLLNQHGIGMGGGGNFALFLDAELDNGSSGACATYSSPTLSNADEFKCTSFEVFSILL